MVRFLTWVKTFGSLVFFYLGLLIQFINIFRVLYMNDFKPNVGKCSIHIEHMGLDD